MTVEGVRIGMVHGDAGRHTAQCNALAAFAADQLDIICFGHSHWPMREFHCSHATEDE